MARIQRFPDGLLQLLQLQSSGVPPQVLGSGVGPSLDMLPFYTSPEEEIVAGGPVSLTATGSVGTSLTVPAGEFWLPRTVTLRLVAATVPFSGAVSYYLVRNNSGAGYFPVPMATGGLFSLTTIGQSLEFSTVLTQPFLLRPGDVFRVESSAIAAGTATGTVSGLFARLSAS